MKLKAVDPFVIEDYSTELQFQGKHVILVPVLEEDKYREIHYNIG